MRRLLHLAVAAALAAVTAPVLLIASLAVLISLGRPVLFRQQRSGLNGVPFEMMKLRTMRSAYGRDGRPLPDEARITRVGRLLRRSRIDELPGLWHILRGEMALVGPRPLLPATIAALGQSGSSRGLVPPGLTGWAQVNGNALLSDQEKLALDLWYISHASALLDLRILLRTAWVVIAGERVHHPALEMAHAGSARRRG